MGEFRAELGTKTFACTTGLNTKIPECRSKPHQIQDQNNSKKSTHNQAKLVG